MKPPPNSAAQGNYFLASVRNVCSNNGYRTTTTRVANPHPYRYRTYSFDFQDPDFLNGILHTDTDPGAKIALLFKKWSAKTFSKVTFSHFLIFSPRKAS
jgi:hypothetical protein